MAGLQLALALLAAAPAEDVLDRARRLTSELRYEEAVVEYQRYLQHEDEPVPARARALFELGFVHAVLGDTTLGEARALEALELDPQLALPREAPSKQRSFLEALRQKARAKVRLDLVPAEDATAAQAVRARLTDPTRRARRVLLRHAMAPSGPYYSVVMSCAESTCAAQIPTPPSMQSYTAWYYVEALDEQGDTLALAGSPNSPSQVSIIQKSPWYKNPWVWGTTGAALVGIAAAVFVASAPPTTTPGE